MKLNADNMKTIIQEMAWDYKLDPQSILEIVQLSIKTAYRKDNPELDRKTNLKVVILGDGEVKIYKEIEIVEEVEDENNEMALAEIQKKSPNVQLGQKIAVDLTPKWYDASRIAAQAAAQTIKQAIKQFEREKFYEKFNDKQWELLKAKVLRVLWDNVLLDINGISVALLPEGQIPGKDYVIGEEIFVLLRKISKDTTGITLDITQSTTDFIISLLTKIIPELEDQKVKIDKIARIAGRRTKIVVSSDDQNIDPVGVFVGQKWARISTVLSLLDWEKVDFVEQNSDDKKFIADCLKPAKINNLTIKWNKAFVEVDESQKSLAIGKWASNIKLACQLSWYEIEII